MPAFGRPGPAHEPDEFVGGWPAHLNWEWCVMQAEVETVEEEVKADSKARRCLMCLEHFVSEWAGQRVCPRCKSTAAWRAG